MRLALIISTWAVLTSLALVFSVIGADYLLGLFGWPDCPICGLKYNEVVGRPVATAFAGGIIVAGGIVACICHVMTTHPRRNDDEAEDEDEDE